MARLSGVQVAYYAWKHNFRSEQLQIAIAVAKAESGWNTTSRLHTSQEDSRGLWQINLYAHPSYNGNSLYDPDYNANAAWQVYSNSNHTWRPWTTYTRGTYKQFMGEAATAVDQLRQQGYNPGGTGTLGPAPTAGDGGTVNAELHERWDYTPSIGAQTNAFLLMGSDFLGNGNFIHDQIHLETFGHG